MYQINFTQQFQKAFKKLTERNKILEERIVKALAHLRLEPKHPSLKSHKVQTPNFGERWSSRVTGDIRIIWDFDEADNLVILALDIGGHSGSGKVYK